MKQYNQLLIERPAQFNYHLFILAVLIYCQAEIQQFIAIMKFCCSRQTNQRISQINFGYKLNFDR